MFSGCAGVAGRVHKNALEAAQGASVKSRRNIFEPSGKGDFMLISGVSNLLHATSTPAPIQPQLLQPVFQQLEQAAAQPSSGAAGTPQGTFLTPPSGSPIAQLLAQFSQSSPSSSVPSTQQDYSAPQTVPNQTTAQSSATQVYAHHHHHHGGGNDLSQLFEQLGQDLQGGNLSEAQQAYGALALDLPQATPASGLLAAPSSSNGISATA